MQFLTSWTSLNYGLLRFSYSISIQYRLTACTWANKSIADCWLRSSRRLLRASLARGLKMASKETRDVSDSNGKGENYQRALTLLNEAVDILRSPCTSTDHPQQLSAHRSVGSVQVPSTSERGELQEMARLFPFYNQGASAGKVSSRQPLKRFWPSASSSGPKKSFKPKDTWTHTFICLCESDQLVVPSWEEKVKEAGLGEKIITFDKYGGYQQLQS